MNTGSKDLALGEAQAGMELASDLVDRQGTVLLQKGSILSASLLTALERRGVTRLRVVGEPDRDGIGLEAARACLDARLAHLFRHQAGGQAGKLRERLLAYRLESL